MLAFSKPLGLPFDGAFIDDPTITWAAKNSSKPGRGTAECWVLHADAGGRPTTSTSIPAKSSDNLPHRYLALPAAGPANRYSRPPTVGFSPGRKTPSATDVFGIDGR